MTGTPTSRPRQESPGVSTSAQETASNATDDARKPRITQFACGERRNCASSNGMSISL